MQAIQTKYFSPTLHKGSRIKAICKAGSIMVNWNYSSNSELNHVTAAFMLMAKLGWVGNIESGQLKDGSWVHVFVEWPILAAER